MPALTRSSLGSNGTILSVAPLSILELDSFFDGLEALNAAIPAGLASLSYVRLTEVPEVFRYRWRTKDVPPRTWFQTMLYASSDPPAQTFNVDGSGFLEQEFMAHRPVRDACLALKTTFGVTDLNITFP